MDLLYGASIQNRPRETGNINSRGGGVSAFNSLFLVSLSSLLALSGVYHSDVTNEDITVGLLPWQRI